MPLLAKERTTELEDNFKKMLFDIDPKTVTVKDINKLFGTTMNVKTGEQTEPILPKNRKITLKAREYINTKDIITTPGIFLFNKIIVEKNEISHIVPDGFYNPDVINKKTYSDFLGLLFPAVVNKKITMEVVQRVVKEVEFWGLKLAITFSPAFTKAVATAHPKVMEEKKKRVAALRKEYGDEVPLDKIVQLEDDLVALNADLIKDDPGMYLYYSGGRGSFENDFKNCNVMVGAMQNPATGKYDMMESNYIEGIAKKDLPIAGNIVVNAGFPKAVGTKDKYHCPYKTYLIAGSAC